MNFLLVGDPHAKPDNLDETRRVIIWSAKLAKQRNAILVLMGDLYDTHGVAKLVIQKFWTDLLLEVLVICGRPALIISGNHDMDYECTASWLSAHTEEAQVIDHEPTYTQLDKGIQIVAIPYIRHNDVFLEVVNRAYQAGYKLALCHQEFDGCQLDNGYYSPNGVDRTKLPEGMTLISGHIHKRQVLTTKSGRDQVIYIGTPRQLTRSDIDEIKGITLWDTDKGAFKESFEFIPTPADIAEPFRHYIVTPESQPTMALNSKSYVDVKGPKDFVKAQLAKLPEGTKVRSFPDPEQRTVSVKESDGIPKAFMNYMIEYSNAKQLNNVTLKAMVERAYSRCPSLRG
jgi:DNA repair exonuclease SbcCD nuclease subunit